MPRKKYTYEGVKKIVEEKGYELLSKNYFNCKDGLYFKCKEGHIFFTTFDNFINGKNKEKCPECDNRIPYNYENIRYFIATNSECQLITKERDLIDVNMKLNIQCKCKDSFEVDFMHFKNHNKRTCNECSLQRTKEIVMYTHDEIVSKIDPTEYKLLEQYKGIKTPIMTKHIKCGHEWMITPDSLLRLKGFCPNCSENKKHEFEFVNKYIIGEGYQLLSKHYTNNATKLDMICAKGHKFSMSFDKFYSCDNRCPHCKRSRGEERIAEYLNSKEITYKFQYKIKDCKNKKQLPFDFAIFDNNKNVQFLCEYQGQHHYQSIDYWGGEDAFIKVLENDEIKQNYCDVNKIPLLKIPYWEFDNINNIIEKELGRHN